MNSEQIKSVLTLAKQIRTNGDIFNPLFVGPPGVGKSQIVQQWCKEQEIPFIDLRAAYLEAPDLIGFPSIEVKEERSVTVHNVPEFLPTKGTGVLLLEEPNRGTTSIMNTMMQLLTDRKIHKYELPKDWIIVGCINPESTDYEVNTMDPALKNRFQIFDVAYDKKSFVKYMKDNQWDKTLISFVESNTWVYTPPEKVANNPGAKYVSPRTLEALNSVLKHKVEESLEMMIYETILGASYGRAFYSFRYNETPVLFNDLNNPKTKIKSLTKLKTYCKPGAYKNGLISVTLADILDDGKITDELLTEVLLVLPADQGVNLIRSLEYKRTDDKLLNRLVNGSPELKEYIKTVLT